ncbi:hypothetical protein NHX12_026817 [Muraenolepis orangiensis]|uniref:F-BAR domain only protein 2 n=1 Tax=Muraenolepis orangiensis TaxID=630683 RepID=A0A9Q0INN0_9TELE|nr:hypothetical protein NHX12_026817 [Muraenolepis orangiensis]
MKHGQISSKELTDFIRERSAIEEAYARSVTKLAKSAGNVSPLGTFAPVWDVFKSSTEKLATCHLELVRKLQELIKEVQKYVDDQAKAHKKTKEEVASTLEAVQSIQTTSQALLKSKEVYNAKTVDQERLRKEGAAQRDVDKAGVKAKKATETYKSYKFQDMEEGHVLSMKEIIRSYSQSLDETHVLIGEVHTEFVSNMENTSVESLVQKLAERPIEFEECNAAIATEGAKPRKRKTFAIPGRRKDKDTDSMESTEVEAANTANGAPPGFFGAIDIQNANVPQVDAEGFCIRPEENSFYSTSDSEDEDEPKKFHVEIKPVQPQAAAAQHQNRTTIDELKASIGNIILSPSASGQMRRNQSSEKLSNNDLLSLDPFSPALAGSSSSVSSSAAPPSPLGPPSRRIAAVGPDGCLAGPSRSKRFLSDSAAPDPYHGEAASDDDDGGGKKAPSAALAANKSVAAATAAPASHMTAGPALNRPTTPLTAGALVPPPRPSSRPKLPTGKLTGINEIVRPPKLSGASPSTSAPLARAESPGPEPLYPLALCSLEPEQLLPPLPAFQKDDDFIANLPTYEKHSETPAGTSRGPSPVTLASQDALPIAVAFTESVNAYFKGADPSKCIVKITGDMTLSFPMGIMKVFTSNPSPAVLTFKLKNTGKLEQILPNQQLLSSDPSQSDANSKDFWFNMQALMSYLRKAAEQNPTASYYNVHSSGVQSTPLNLAVYWKCAAGTTDLCLDYRFNPEPMSGPGALANVQILVPVDGGVTSMQALPSGIWNAEQNKFLWKLSDISDKTDNDGACSLRAKFELSSGPSTPATVAVQFMNEGNTLSGVDMELQGTGYRLSLSKKRFATGRYMADC